MIINKREVTQLLIFIDSLAIVASSPELKLKLYELNELVKEDEGNPRYEVDYVLDWVEDYLGMQKMKEVAIEVMDAFMVYDGVGKATALYLQKNI